MRFLPVFAAATLFVCCPGCRSFGRAMMDGVVDSILDIEAECDDEEDVEIDPEILKRKGIEPGSERHKRLVYEEKFNRDFQKKRYAEDEETELKPDWSSDP